MITLFPALSLSLNGFPCYVFRVMRVARPLRIVCLSAEAVETLYGLGCEDLIVGVTAFAVQPPAARRKRRVSGFSTVKYDKIDALKPDLVITFSDVQAEATRELVRRGHTVLATNQRSLGEVFTTIKLIGRVVGRETQAHRLVEKMRRSLAAPASCRPGRAPAGRQDAGAPRVYFEEWHDPLISGIGWVSELIDAAGGRDVFSELRHQSRAPDRVVQPDEVVRRNPDIIIASWCGRKANLDAIRRRRGWESIRAIRNDRVYEIESADILQPGPGLLRGFRELRRIISDATQGNTTAR